MIAGGAGLYTVHEDDLMTAIVALAQAETLQPKAIPVAHPTPVALPDMLEAFAAQEGRRCLLVPVPWQSVYTFADCGDHPPTPSVPCRLAPRARPYRSVRGEMTDH